ncbi:MAG TPA: hypothetical protein VF669_19045 [Tepidisphaeraceae bacterium]
MGVQDGKGVLARAMKDLMNRWHDTRAQWNDENAKRFEQERLINLEQDLRSAVSAMDTMSVLLQQIRRDCE